MNNILGLIALTMGAIVGAGFASGKEIITFFNNTGNFSIYNIAISILLFFITFYCLFKIIYSFKITTFEDLITLIANKKIAKIVKNIMNIFLIIIFWIMIAGFGSYLSELLNINSILGSIILSFFCYITLKFNIQVIIRINKIITPVIILSICLLFFNSSINYTPNLNSTYTYFQNLSFGIIYACYNLIIAIPVIISGNKLIKNNNHLMLSALLICIILFILIFFIFLLNNTYILNISNLNIPLLYIANEKHIFIYIIYTIMIGLTIYTTAISLGYTIISKYANNKNKANFLSFCICILGIIVSNIDFSILIKYCFSFIGIIGFIEVFLIIKFMIKNTINK